MARIVSKLQYLTLHSYFWCGNGLFEIQQRNFIKYTLAFGLDEFHYKKWRAPLTPTYRHGMVHICVIWTVIPPIFIQNVLHMYINISLKYHRIAGTQSCIIAKVHDLLGQPSYILQSTKEKLNNQLVDPKCQMCRLESEDHTHFLLKCTTFDWYCQSREIYIRSLIDPMYRKSGSHG